MPKKIAISALLIFLGVFSAFILWGVIITPNSYSGYIELIDQNISTVMRLTGASTAASAAITVIPGDTATPIAEKLADFSTYFLLVLCVLYLEKFLIGLTGYAAFVWCFPIACVVGAVGLFIDKRIFKSIALKAACLGVALLLLIPSSVKLSDKVYQMYQPKIESTVTAATDISTGLESTVNEQNEKTGFIESISNTVTEKFSLAINSAEQLISRYIEALAIMLVVSCIIPILVVLFFLWILKQLFGIRIPLSKVEWERKHEKVPVAE